MRHLLAIGAKLYTIFSWTATTFPWTATTFPWTACIISCVLRYFFGRRNPYFCMR